MVAEIFALLMFVNTSLDGHLMTDGLSNCLKLKREAERNLSQSSEGNMKIKAIIEKKF